MTMNDKKFVSGIRQNIITSNLETYRKLFAHTRPDDASDPYWKAALRLSAGLDDAEREVLYGIMRQVMVDTVSSMLAVLDGISDLPGQDGVFDVRIGGNSIAGSLQDTFLTAEEEDSD